MAPLVDIAAYRLQVPLTKPYRLAFGTVRYYDVILVTTTNEAGGCGFGEATILTGYTDETIEEAWPVARDFAARLANESPQARAASVQGLGAKYPFTATAFGAALEMLAAPQRFESPPARVPLVGMADAQGQDALEAQIDTLLVAGYRTIKIKVGFDVESDVRYVSDVQRAVRGRARIRIDANQGYTADQGVAFVRALDPCDIELFEQPCAAGDWESHRRVARAAGVPLMLDESIYGIEDIEKAATLECAQYIKVKLMKFGTLEALAAAIRRIRALGMQAVLGNGVACDPGCWQEACVAAEHIDNAGEMNGFLKTEIALLGEPLAFEAGAIELRSGYRPALDMENVRRCCIDSMTCRTRAVHNLSARQRRA